jgi:excisionase family DNA binding protein
LHRFGAREASQAHTTRGDWVGLAEASRLLGVAPGTLRRWSDAGRVSVFTTPGGHRRFRRASLERMVADRTPARPSLVRSGLTRTRLVRAYRGRGHGTLAWVDELDPGQREAFRTQGRRLVGTLLAHLDASDPANAEHHLADAASQAAAYGRLVAGLGVSLSGAVEGFLAFRRPFLDQLAVVAVQRSFDAAETTSLMDGAERAMDRLLLAMMTAYSVHQVGEARRARRPRPIAADPVRP